MSCYAYYGAYIISPDALERNQDKEFERNSERFQFLKYVLRLFLFDLTYYVDGAPRRLTTSALFPQAQVLCIRCGSGCIVIVDNAR